MTRRLPFLAAFAAMALAGPAVAQNAAPDPAAVRVLAGPCANCHGPDGHSPGAIPSIAGLDAADTLKKLRGFRDGSEPSTVMGRLARGYDDAQLAALAQWFAEVAK